MLWNIRKGIRKQKVLNAQGHLCGYITHKASSYEISDITGNRLMIVRSKSPLGVQIQGENGVADAVIHLEGASAFMRPPKAKELTLSIGDSVLTIEQSPQRDYAVIQDDKEIGWITGIPCNPQIILTVQAPFEFVAMLYVLALRMYHEDDIDIV